MDVHLNLASDLLTPRVQALTLSDGRRFLVLGLTFEADVILPFFDAEAVACARDLANVLLEGADALERALDDARITREESTVVWGTAPEASA